MKAPSRQLLGGLLIAGSFAILGAAYALLQVVSRGHSLGGAIQFIASFACIGLLLGTIFAFDGGSEVKTTDRPFVRIAVGCFSGLLLALIWHWLGDGIALSVLLSGILGYLGTFWARYVDFY
ncbi:hypothetical protein [Polaromonas sp. JS666]|uniref:hypothetical protein n=1 Tax=Polaromonas sp. (strain JS666 / ATCC BAA-500) TaxID=296591 RepID=UPI00005371B8|nr:hypothetical protein [Polaromonas sp. JS666]ABE42433.1 hypothetical protein Bpro_0469 [Polaromonas sp. JS666]